MKTLKLLPIMFLMLSYNLFPDCSVSGYVKEINTEIPIHRVAIYIHEDNKQKKDQEQDLYIVKTDKKGFFNISIATPGDYSIFVEIPGVGVIAYTTIVEENFYKFNIKEGQKINFIFRIGENTMPVLEKKVSEDGNTIHVKMLYYKRDKSNRQT